MIRIAVALRYAKALFDLDHAEENLEKRIGEFEAVQELLKNDPKLLKVLQAPQISLQEKEQMLKDCLPPDKFDSTFFHFLIYLIKNGKLNDLVEIVLEYRLMVDKYLGIWEAKILTAVPIEPDVEEKLRKKLEIFYHKKMKIKKEVDPQIIGGAILIVDDNEMIDWSVASRLRKMKEQLLAINI